MKNLNPFDEPQQRSLVPRNEQQQYSLWPNFCAIPAHWTVAFGPVARTECTEWLERHWQNIQSVSPPGA